MHITNTICSAISMSSLKQIKRILPKTSPHFVGDGFFVSTCIYIDTHCTHCICNKYIQSHLLLFTSYLFIFSLICISLTNMKQRNSYVCFMHHNSQQQYAYSFLVNAINMWIYLNTIYVRYIGVITSITKIMTYTYIKGLSHFWWPCLHRRSVSVFDVWLWGS